MELQSKYSINEIIDLSALQNIQDKFTKITGLASVTVDENGTPIVNTSNFSNFCNLIRSSKEGRRRCFLCDAEGGNKAMRAKEPVIYNCHAGLTDVAAPIIVNDVYLAYMLSGQVITKEFGGEAFVNIPKLSRELRISKDKLQKAFDELPRITYDEIKDASDFLHFFANLIAKMGFANITHTELLQKTREKMKLEQLLNDMKIKTLQSQINPHFLFNTLNTIARMALIEDAVNTEDLIYALSDILRYSIKNTENMVDIRTEINNIEKYLLIQNKRYGDRIQYQIKVDPQIQDCKIPVMTLQPIVENAIVHGLEPKKDGGKIVIEGKEIFEEYINIQIYDNGMGIKEDKLRLIMENKNSSESSTGIGIQNVKNRIKYYFGEEYGLSIESTYKTGTKVTINIPLTR